MDCLGFLDQIFDDNVCVMILVAIVFYLVLSNSSCLNFIGGMSNDEVTQNTFDTYAGDDGLLDQDEFKKILDDVDKDETH